MSAPNHRAEPRYNSIFVAAHGTLTTTELGPLLDALRDQFMFVRTETPQMAPPMAGANEVGVALRLIVDGLHNDVVKFYLLHVFAKWAEADAASFRKALLDTFRRVKHHNPPHRVCLQS